MPGRQSQTVLWVGAGTCRAAPWGDEGAAFGAVEPDEHAASASALAISVKVSLRAMSEG
jgi:hypothetical protein